VLPREGQLATNEEVEYDEEGEYDDDEDEDEDDVDEGQEGPEPKGTHVKEEPIPPPPPPFNLPSTFETSRSSSSAYMPFEPAFLQSFFALQLEVLVL